MLPISGFIDSPLAKSQPQAVRLEEEGLFVLTKEHLISVS